MKNNSFGENVMALLIVIGIFVVIGALIPEDKPKCIKSGCNNNQASGSSYCYTHKSKYSNSSSSGSSTKVNRNNKTNTTGGSSYSNSTKNNHKNSTTTKKNSYDSYDEGYDDIYVNGDYDYDRYRNDREYADGVDDAMDDCGEEW